MHETSRRALSSKGLANHMVSECLSNSLHALDLGNLQIWYGPSKIPCHNFVGRGDGGVTAKSTWYNMTHGHTWYLIFVSKSGMEEGKRRRFPFVNIKDLRSSVYLVVDIYGESVSKFLRLVLQCHWNCSFGITDIWYIECISNRRKDTYALIVSWYNTNIFSISDKTEGKTN